MFSTTICVHVLQAIVCVAPRARCRSVPSAVWGHNLAASAARSRPEFRHEPDLLGFEPPRPPWSTPGMVKEPRRQHIPTTKVVSSVIGCAMHMKWPDRIGRGSWDWENPRQESANHIPALPVLTGHAIGSPHSGGSGSTPMRSLLLLLLLLLNTCLLYTSPSPRDQRGSRMPSSA